MTLEDEISLLSSIARLYRHVMEGQQEVVKLKARVKTLEDAEQLRDLLDSEPKGAESYSLPHHSEDNQY